MDPLDSTSLLGPSQSTNRFDIKVIPSSELIHPSQKTLLRNLAHLLNDAFSIAAGMIPDNGETAPEAYFTRKRVVKDEDWPMELGSQGLTAICTDTTLNENIDGNNKSVQKPQGTYGNVVATGSLKPWKGKVSELGRSILEALGNQNGTNAKSIDLANLELAQAAHKLAAESKNELVDTWNWEVSTCASSHDPQYRRQGLVVQCVEALITKLKERQRALKESGDPKGDIPIRLWITSVEGTGNTEYWLRRGYVKVGEADLAAAGTWTCTRDLWLQTMCKTIN